MWIRSLARPLWNRKHQMLPLAAPAIHIQRAKSTLATNIDGSQWHGNSNKYNTGIDISGDLRRLCEQGLLNEALHVLHVMGHRGIRPDSSIYVSLLQGCIDKKAVREGKLVHAHMIGTGFNPGIFLGNNLVTMYAKCGSLVDARRVLDEMPNRNVFSWTTMIAAYARYGHNEEALRLYYQMQREGIQPNKCTFAGVLPACANLASLRDGKEVHEDIIRSGLQSDIFVGSALVDMYAKCGVMDSARQAFDEMPERNIVSWNSLIAGCAQNGYVDEALEHFRKMPERDVVSWTAMISGYAQNGQVDEALELFEKMPKRNQVAWTAMIAGYAQNGRIDEGVKLFQRMPDRDVISWNVMIAGCARNGLVGEALKLFEKMCERDVVSWNAIIAGFAQNGHDIEALEIFHQMQLTGTKPDSVSFTGVLPACCNLAARKNGKEVHGTIVRSRFYSHTSVGNALVDMYAKCGSIEDAFRVFDEMLEHNVVSWNAMIAGYAYNGCVDDALKLFQKMPKQDDVSWNAMIAGYAQNGHFNETLKLLRQMYLTGVKPDYVTFITVLPACANLVDLINGKAIHKNIIRNGFQSHISVASALVDMYAKCGAIDDACKVFDKMPERDIVSWNAMIVGYAKHGCGKEALQRFAQMQHSGMKPNHITFVGVLSACSHAGLVYEGWHYFDCMSRDYHLPHSVEHYCCMVDLLGRAGRLDEARNFINRMPIKPNASVWGSLLGACRIHNNTELGEFVAERLFELDPRSASCYVLLSNIYAAAGRWDDVEKVRNSMKDKKLKQIPGCSWIDVNNKLYSFVVKNRSAPQTDKSYVGLERLSQQMKAGYVSNMNSVLYDVEKGQKEHLFYQHSKMLDIAYPCVTRDIYLGCQAHLSMQSLPLSSSSRLFCKKLL